MAGYRREMERLLDSNSGLRLRFPTALDFPDYSRSELQQIYAKLADDAGYTLAEGLLARVGGLLGTAEGHQGVRQRAAGPHPVRGDDSATVHPDHRAARSQFRPGPLADAGRPAVEGVRRRW
jgi:hypothetical protein